jgi:CBS domain-containing protein
MVLQIGLNGAEPMLTYAYLALKEGCQMLTVADIMTTEVITISSSATVAQAIAVMQAEKVRSLIVEKSHEFDTYGIVTERDIVYEVIAYGDDPEQVYIHEILRKPCIKVSPDLTLQEAAQQFSDAAIQRAPVVCDGKLAGMLSVTDIIMKLPVREQSQPDALSQRIQTALQHARVICDEQSSVTQECAVAWDIVEELQAEAAHRRAQ